MRMDIMALLIFSAIGAVAGWLAGLLMHGGGFGLLGDIVVGIIGALVGGYLSDLVGISIGGGLVGAILTAPYVRIDIAALWAAFV